ncbi:multiubiquitin domain-containing protein [Flavisphingomonas formosensis]|uniref:multiubiquitin domain-containing protein n=1 Tax=Flavisphingomonas formosensis TaxID=861534 RepID=UPI0012F8B743|nr:multiubiquitin domain-containing protein [Sphingomonas formosensis]
MKFGSQSIGMGRYVVDVDGRLYTTDKRTLTASDVMALSGSHAATASVVWEIYGESVLLGSTDRVDMSEDRVAFFRIREGAGFFRSPHDGARFTVRVSDCVWTLPGHMPIAA